MAAENGLVWMTSLLLAHGASVSEVAEGGLTPLHVAAAVAGRDDEGIMEVARLLMAHGADSFALDDEGSTAAAVAEASRADPHAMLCLLSADGAPPSCWPSNAVPRR